MARVHGEDFIFQCEVLGARVREIQSNVVDVKDTIKFNKREI
jgi:hypothetical protein